MVSEPTPTASFSPGAARTVAVIEKVVLVPLVVTLTVDFTVPALGQTPSTRSVQLFVRPGAAVTGPGRPVAVQVHGCVLDFLMSKNDGIPATIFLLIVTRI